MHSPAGADFANALFFFDDLLWFLGATLSGSGLVDVHCFLHYGPVVSHCLPVIYDGLVIDGADDSILPRGVGNCAINHVVFVYIFRCSDILLKTNNFILVFTMLNDKIIPICLSSLTKFLTSNALLSTKTSVLIFSSSLASS